jgi:hypothetical protein
MPRLRFIEELIEDPASKKFSVREKAALRYADLKQGEQATTARPGA